ncbi:hypothetical protein [Nitrospirillum sp. BR 11163]|uniref:hypothetical protein n=1 Tax=Nitrospirillum sp. BR 11163 TaxID=3104323 RepID=UPI002AFEA8B8|nr:hypothetical protein [Nitrospirillum sp. BR 11163]MEA1677030.1 hypothetical protein [Nitrospirillum sp. BR 11163]
MITRKRSLDPLFMVGVLLMFVSSLPTKAGELYTVDVARLRPLSQWPESIAFIVQDGKGVKVQVAANSLDDPKSATLKNLSGQTIDGAEVSDEYLGQNLHMGGQTVLEATEATLGKQTSVRSSPLNGSYFNVIRNDCGSVIRSTLDIENNGITTRKIILYIMDDYQPVTISCDGERPVAPYDKTRLIAADYHVLPLKDGNILLWGVGHLPMPFAIKVRPDLSDLPKPPHGRLIAADWKTVLALQSRIEGPKGLPPSPEDDLDPQLARAITDAIVAGFPAR